MTLLVTGLFNVSEGEVFLGDYPFKSGSSKLEDGYYLGMVEIAKDEIVYYRGGFKIGEPNEQTDQALLATIVAKVHKLEEVTTKDGSRSYQKCTFCIYRGSLESLIYASCPVIDGLVPYLEKGTKVMVTGQLQLTEKQEKETDETKETDDEKVEFTFPYFLNLYKAKLNLIGDGSGNGGNKPKPVDLSKLAGGIQIAKPVVDPVSLVDTDGETF